MSYEHLSCVTQDWFTISTRSRTGHVVLCLLPHLTARALASLCFWPFVVVVGSGWNASSCSCASVAVPGIEKLACLECYRPHLLQVRQAFRALLCVEKLNLRPNFFPHPGDVAF
jgi:hypothetical protein